MYGYFTVVYLIFFQKFSCACTSEFSPDLPFIFRKSCTVNIVKSSSLQNIPVIPSCSPANFQHTYTIHNISSLNFEISEKNLKMQNQAVSFKMGYLRLKTRYSECPTIFVLYTNDNLFEMLYAIQKSGFGKSEDALFFTHVSSLVNRNIEILNQFLKMLPASNFKPFHAQILFFDLPRDKLLFMCYFCEPNFGRVRQLVNYSLKSIHKISTSLNSQGYGHKVPLRLELGDLTLLIDLFKPLLGSTQSAQVCLYGYTPSRDNYDDYKELLNTLKKCDRKIVMALSSVQEMLNITILLVESLENSNTANLASWNLQLLASARLVASDELNFLSMRGSLHSYIDVLKEYCKFVGCVSYESYSTYDPSMLYIIEWPVWLALLLTSFVISYIKNDFSKGFSVLQLSMGYPINEKGFERYLITCFLIPITFHCTVFQSHISSDSTKLPDFPQDIDWFLRNGFRILQPTKSLVELAYNTIMPDHVKDNLFRLTHTHNLDDYLSDVYIPVTNISDMARSVSEKKVAIGNFFEEYSFFSYFFDKHYTLVDNKYACSARNYPLYESLVLVGVRLYGYLSKRFEQVLLKFLERGEIVKFQKLISHIHFQERISQKTEVVYLDKVAPPQPIDSASIVGLSCVTVFGIGVLLLLVEFLVRLLQVLGNKLNRFYTRFIKKTLSLL